mmetsp:Transcript_4731/g.11627  ORF Transcript_4731/g.11627 Transcript_4731/m.11627 type:complete len:280 (-) Transcript_4731:621-1460(-)
MSQEIFRWEEVRGGLQFSFSMYSTSRPVYSLPRAGGRKVAAETPALRFRRDQTPVQVQVPQRQTHLFCRRSRTSDSAATPARGGIPFRYFSAPFPRPKECSQTFFLPSLSAWPASFRPSAGLLRPPSQPSRVASSLSSRSSSTFATKRTARPHRQRQGRLPQHDPRSAACSPPSPGSRIPSAALCRRLDWISSAAAPSLSPLLRRGQEEHPGKHRLQPLPFRPVPPLQLVLAFCPAKVGAAPASRRLRTIRIPLHRPPLLCPADRRLPAGLIWRSTPRR